jgi:ribonucleoside-diphosphate reductase alpha chain
VVMEVKKSTLEGLSEKIFLDRYAEKDLNTDHAKVGDVVLVLTLDDPKFPKKEVGEIVARDGKQLQIRLRNGQTIDSTLDHITLPKEQTPEELWDRLARAISSVEKTSDKQEEWRQKFRQLLDDWKLVPGGRIAAGAGTSDELTLFNCYVIPSPHDSRGGIMETLGQMTEIMSRGGGVGINLSSLRPRRALVKGVNGSSSGAVSWGGLFSYTTGLIEQGGSRRGALMLMINDWHPDLLDFITVKQTMGQITNANLSVCVSNGFMKAVKEDLDWDLVFPDTSDPDYDQMWDGDLKKWQELGKSVKHFRTVRARDVWHTIIESAWKSAEPGIVFMEYYNQMSNSWYFNPIICTNPCGEQGLPAWGVCNLSAINLSKFYDEENHDVAWDELRTAVHYATRFLDNVIDATPYHFEANRQNQQGERRTGLGSMGLAELMIKLGVRYGSADSLEFLDKLYGFIAREAYLASSEIAGEKGSFEHYDEELFLQSGFMKHMVEEFPEVGQSIQANGMRNVTVLTQAPTGSTGTMVGTSTGIEPYFAFEYFRQSRLGFDKQLVPIAKDWVDAHPGEELPEYFVTAQDLNAEDHVRVQAAIQKWVDSSISKTANAPHDFSVEDTKRLYELAFDLGCKGVTIYRDGSRDVQVLSTDKSKKTEAKGEDLSDKAENAAPAPSLNPASVTAASSASATSTKEYQRRPKILQGATYKMNTPLGKAYITINGINGVPFEVIVNVGKAGSDVFAMSEALGRVSTLFLRFGDLPDGNKTRLLIKHLKGIGGSGAVGFGANRVESIADAVAKALELHIDGNQVQNLTAAASTEVSDYASKKAEAVDAFDQEDDYSFGGLDLCPSCGSASLVNAEGCKTCSSCGFSKCS